MFRLDEKRKEITISYRTENWSKYSILKRREAVAQCSTFDSSVVRALKNLHNVTNQFICEQSASIHDLYSALQKKIFTENLH